MPPTGVDIDVLFNTSVISSNFKKNLLGRLVKEVDALRSSIQATSGPVNETAALRAVREQLKRAEDAVAAAEAAFARVKTQVCGPQTWPVLNLHHATSTGSRSASRKA